MGTGNPSAQLRPAAPCRVYPRGHGESRIQINRTGELSGLSPWARGIPKARSELRPGTGSIPVGTGNPAFNVRVRPVVRVYPRGHGESVGLAAQAIVGAGLSPWARGIRTHQAYSSLPRRSIPVGTGNPRSITKSR